MKIKDHPKVQKFLNEVTLGLESDPELRLEVRAELLSHLEAHLDESPTQDDEAIEEAISSLGASSEISTRMIEANASRMKTRSLISTFLRRFFIPVALILALWVSVSEGRRYFTIQAISTHFNTDAEQPLAAKILGAPTFNEAFEARINQEMTEEAREFLLIQDQDRSQSEKAYDLWQKSPQSKARFAYYVSQHLTHQDTLPDDLKKHAAAVDPENGFYPFLSATISLKNVITKEKKKASSQSKSDAEPIWNITDQEAFEASIEKIEAALKMPTFKTYHGDFMQERLTHFPEPQKSDLTNTFDQYLFVAGIAMPEIINYHRSSDAMALRVQQLQEAEDREAISTYVQLWLESMPKLVSSGEFLVGNFVNLSITQKWGHALLTACETLDLDQEQQALKPRLNRLDQAKEEFHSGREGLNTKLSPKESAQVGLWSDMIYISAVQEEKIDVATTFKPSRKLDFILFERAWITAFLFLLFFGALLCAGATLKWKFFNKDHTPFLLLLQLKDYALILSLGLLVPLAIFFFLSRFTSFGGHDWSVAAVSFQISSQLILLTLLILSLLIQLTRLRVIKRLRDLGETELPHIKPKTFWFIPCILALSFFVTGFFPAMKEPQMVFQIFIIVSVVLTMGWLIIRISHSISGGKKNPSYAGNISRAMIPVLSSAMVLLGFVVIPILQQQEETWVARDQIMGPDNQVFKLELQSADWLQNEMLTAFNQQ